MSIQEGKKLENNKSISEFLYTEKTYLLKDKYQSVMFQILIYCFVKNILLSKGEILALSYFYIDGISRETEDKILERGIFSNSQTVANLKSKLVHLGILKKDETSRTYYINNFMGIASAEKVAISIKAGNK